MAQDIAEEQAKLYEAILVFEDGFHSYALGVKKTVIFPIESSWDLLRQLWEEKSKPHTFVTLKMYLRWKQNRSKD